MNEALINDIIRGACECERPEKHDTDTVELRVSDLRLILERHLAALASAPAGVPSVKPMTLDDPRNKIRHPLIRDGYAEGWNAALLAMTASPPPQATAPADLLAQLEEMTARKDAAYEERNRVVAALASAHPSGIARTAIEGWSEDWHGCVYIDLPTGQASWHYHDSQAHLFAHLPPYVGSWDGHTTPEKYERLASLAKPAPAPAGAMEDAANYRWLLAGVRTRQGIATSGHRSIGRDPLRALMEFNFWCSADEVHAAITAARQAGKGGSA